MFSKVSYTVLVLDRFSFKFRFCFYRVVLGKLFFIGGFFVVSLI